MGHEDVMDSVLGNPATQEMTSAQAIHSHRVHPKFRCFGGLCGRTLRPSLPPNPLELALATSYLTGHHFQHSFLESDDPSKHVDSQTWIKTFQSLHWSICSHPNDGLDERNLWAVSLQVYPSKDTLVDWIQANYD